MGYIYNPNTQEAKAERIPVEAWATGWDLKAKTQTNKYAKRWPMSLSPAPRRQRKVELYKASSRTSRATWKNPSRKRILKSDFSPLRLRVALLNLNFKNVLKMWFWGRARRGDLQDGMNSTRQLEVGVRLGQPTPEFLGSVNSKDDSGIIHNRLLAEFWSGNKYPKRIAIRKGRWCSA